MPSPSFCWPPSKPLKSCCITAPASTTSSAIQLFFPPSSSSSSSFSPHPPPSPPTLPLSSRRERKQAYSQIMTDTIKHKSAGTIKNVLHFIFPGAARVLGSLSAGAVQQRNPDCLSTSKLHLPTTNTTTNTT